MFFLSSTSPHHQFQQDVSAWFLPFLAYIICPLKKSEFTHIYFLFYCQVAENFSRKSTDSAYFLYFSTWFFQFHFKIDLWFKDHIWHTHGAGVDDIVSSISRGLDLMSQNIIFHPKLYLHLYLYQPVLNCFFHTEEKEVLITVCEHSTLLLWFLCYGFY